MTKKLKEQIIIIRDSGETNMFDLHKVRQLAVSRGFNELVHYIDNHKDKYINFIFCGTED